MFTGIVEEIETVHSHESGALTIACDRIREDVALGDSIAINGVDLTVSTIADTTLSFDVMTETYRRANLTELSTGDIVNLERSVSASTRLSGHIVRGVVETTCTVDSFTPEGEAIIARYLVEPEFLKFIVMKGPVAIDGVSLTVMDRDAKSFAVSLVQYTQENTNLTRRQVGDQINLETDIFARYVEQLLKERTD